MNRTCTIPRVALVTGSEKSPPGGDTAPTILTEPSRSGLPRHLTLRENKFYYILHTDNDKYKKHCSNKIYLPARS